ncbi:MAG: hypothetical protein ABI183_00525 [Polyangiaceae bacterium]
MLVVFTAAAWSAGCGGQSIETDSQDAATPDAEIADALAFDSEAIDADATASSCPPHQVTCNGVCTDTRFDPSACGTCTNSCGPSEVCASGACTSTCPASQAACKDGDGGLRCADALNDNANCGYCGNVCGAGTICSNGKCSLTCGADETRCTAGDSTAFCTNLQTDPDDCNLCGNACPIGNNTGSTFCASGKCGVTCVSGALDCNANPIDGCEVFPTGDRTNCGACGNICPVGAACVNGGCTCGTGYNQTLEACNGTCTDVQRDPTNCGGCGTRCSAATVYQTADCVESACHTSNRAVITASSVTSIAIDDTYLYFVQQGTGIRRVTKGSTAETPVSVIADTTAYGMAINAGTIFWTNAYGVYKCPVTGCVGSPKAVSDVPSSNSRIVVDDTSFYWTVSAGINKCAQTGCNDAPVLMTNQYSYSTTMTPGPSSLFVVNGSYGYGLESITLSDPPTTTVVSSTTAYQSGLAYHSGQLYFDNPGYLVSCDPTACVPKVLAALPVSFNGGPIIADDTAVLWAADGIHETNLATAADSVIANIKTGATQLALDATNVYWAGNDGVYWAAR